MDLRISVLVPTYNRAKFLPASLESILSQTVAPFEVILVDDGSTDETAKIVRQYGDRLLYLPKPNGGKSTALNLGLQHVRGDYVWIMDDDDVALPNALERLVDPLEKCSYLGMSFGTHLIAESLPNGFLGNAVERKIPVFPDADLFLALIEYGNFLGQGAFLTRAAVCHEVGPYNTGLVRSQDFEMLLRLSAICRAIRVPGPMFIYRQHSDFRGSADDRHAAPSRLSKWRFYDRIVYKRIFEDVPLERYLPVMQSLSISPIAVRRAYLQRMVMLWRAGLFDELLEDLDNALDIHGPLSKEEVRVLSGCYPWEDQPGYWRSNYIRVLRNRTRGTLGRQIRMFLAQSVYWRARLDFAACHYRLAWRNLRGFMLILGWTGIPNVLKYKLQGKLLDSRSLTCPD